MNKPAQATQITEKPQIFQFLEQYQGQIEAALPRTVTIDRMMRVVTTSIRKNPDLGKCTPISLFGSIIQVAQVGLEPDTELREAHFIPFWNGRKKCFEVQLIIGYRGYLKLAWNSGQLAGMQAEAVFEQDHFKYRRGLNDMLEHIPSEEENRGALTHSYCIFDIKGGGHIWRVLNRNDIARIKQFAKGLDRNDSPWNTHEAEMWMKSAIRATSKFAPMSADMRMAITVDEEGDVRRQDFSHLLDVDYHPTLPPPTEPDERTTTEKVRDKVLNGNGEASQQEESPEPPAEPEKQKKATNTGAPTEADLFAGIESAKSVDDLNAIAAASEVVSTESMAKFRKALGDKAEELRPQASAQGAFFGQ